MEPSFKMDTNEIYEMVDQESTSSQTFRPTIKHSTIAPRSSPARNAVKTRSVFSKCKSMSIIICFISVSAAILAMSSIIVSTLKFKIEPNTEVQETLQKQMDDVMQQLVLLKQAEENTDSLSTEPTERKISKHISMYNFVTLQELFVRYFLYLLERKCLCADGQTY